MYLFYYVPRKPTADKLSMMSGLVMNPSSLESERSVPWRLADGDLTSLEI